MIEDVPTEEYSRRPANRKIVNFSQSTGKNKAYDPILPNTSNGGFFCAIIGARGSGKSNLLLNLMRKDMLGKTFKKEHTILFSPSVKLDDTMDKIPAKYKYEKFDPKQIENVMAQQKQIKEDYGRAKMPEILIIFDDNITERTFKAGSLLETLGYRARHLNISCIFTTQKFSALARGIRVNATNVMIFEPKKGSELDHIVEEYASKSNRKAFIKMMEYAWKKPYSFFYMNFLEKDKRKTYWVNFDTPLQLKDF